MAFRLDSVVPWGRSFDEYAAMFALSEEDLATKRILGCGDGPASFNTELTRRGGRVISVDPIYAFSPDEIRDRIETTYATVLEQTRANADAFVWQHIGSIEELGRARKAAMDDFLADFTSAGARDRYIAAGLPDLPFAGGSFDLALSSHLLFLYSEQLSEDFHVAAIRELARVANEVRVFPVLELGATRSRHLEPVLVDAQREGLEVTIETVLYEFQRGGNEMLRLRHGASRT